MGLASEARTLLDMVYRVGAPRFHELSPAQARHAFQKLLFAFRPPVPGVGAVTDLPIPRPGAGVLLARHYRPIDRSPDQTLPLLLYFHGGGWCVGDIESYDVLCRQLANEAGCAVLSVEYRLAPEHPFPAAPEDALLALRWAHAQAGLLGIDPTRIALAGDSAGGNLALVSALAWRGQTDRPPLRHLCLIYPSTEILSERPSRQAYSQGYFLDQESLDWFFSRYLPRGDHDDWRASPMRAASLAGLPSVHLVTAEYDPLVDECIAFAERAVAEGVPLTHRACAGLIHGFVPLGKFFPQAAPVIQEAAHRLRQALA